MKIQTRLLFGRLLTRSGDQAWDFAVPIVLLQLFPDHIRIAATFYLLTRLLSIFILPPLASQIDRATRMVTAQTGMTLQLIGVVLGACAVSALSEQTIESFRFLSTSFALLTAGGLMASLGSSIMDIAIANDLVPASLNADELAGFNSRLRQLDLFTEVTSPIIAGLLLLLDYPPLLGFYIIAAWNIFSFAPEFIVIKSVLDERSDLLEKRISVSSQQKANIFVKLSVGWSSFFKQPVALVAVSYSFLWLSALSPHGVLLTGFLKDGWHLPEWAIGLFRGAGAVFGLIATIIYPWAEKRWGMVIASRNFISFQAVILIVAIPFLFLGTLASQIGFLFVILLSRIGLYGFSLGEMQIRQVGIAPNVRGEVNGFANSLNGIAALLLYAGGALLPTTEDFQKLVLISVGAVLVGCLIFISWTNSHQSRIFKKAGRTAT